MSSLTGEDRVLEEALRERASKFVPEGLPEADPFFVKSLVQAAVSIVDLSDDCFDSVRLVAESINSDDPDRVRAEIVRYLLANSSFVGSVGLARIGGSTVVWDADEEDVVWRDVFDIRRNCKIGRTIFYPFTNAVLGVDGKILFIASYEGSANDRYWGTYYLPAFGAENGWDEKSIFEVLGGGEEDLREKNVILTDIETLRNGGDPSEQYPEFKFKKSEE